MSCAVLTVLVGLVISPVVTLMFGVALLPFSWPHLAAVPILLGTAVALSQGGVGQAWPADPSGTCAARPSSSRPRPPPGGCRTCARPA